MCDYTKEGGIVVRRAFIAILISMVVLWWSFYLVSEPLAKGSGRRFSDGERQWAVEWINKKLALLMEDGLIKKIKCSENERSYEVFVSSSWRLLGGEAKRDFLRNLSRAREITGHSPYLVVKDSQSGELVAQVNEWGIFIFGE